MEVSPSMKKLLRKTKKRKNKRKMRKMRKTRKNKKRNKKKRFLNQMGLNTWKIFPKRRVHIASTKILLLVQVQRSEKGQLRSGTTSDLSSELSLLGLWEIKKLFQS